MGVSNASVFSSMRLYTAQTNVCTKCPGITYSYQSHKHHQCVLQTCVHRMMACYTISVFYKHVCIVWWLVLSYHGSEVEQNDNRYYSTVHDLYNHAPADIDYYSTVHDLWLVQSCTSCLKQPFFTHLEQLALYWLFLPSHALPWFITVHYFHLLLFSSTMAAVVAAAWSF